MAKLTTDDVWRVLEKQNFMVVGMVSARGQARTAGVMPYTTGRKLWFTTNDDEWKARHIAANLEVSGMLLGVGIRPVGDFITYGVGVPVVKMLDTEAARGRAPSGG